MSVSGDYTNKHYHSVGGQSPELSFAEQVKSGVVNLDALQDTQTPFEAKIQVLLDHQARGNSLFVQMGNHVVPLKIEEVEIVKGKDLTTQVKEPLYQRALVAKSKEGKCYAFHFQDPYRKPSEEYLEAKKFDRIEKKIFEGDDLTPDETSFYSRATEGKSHEEAKILAESVKEEFETPMIKLRIVQTGELGEVANIAVHSDVFNGRSLMELTDKFCTSLGVKEMYLEDDSQIESPNGSYSLQLFRYFTGKGSWYEDAFQYRLYGSSAATDAIEDKPPSQEVVKPHIHPLATKTVGEVKKILEDPGFDPKKCEALKVLLAKQDEKLTMKELIAQFGKEIQERKKPLHRNMNTLLSGYLEVLKDYKGQDPAILQLQQNAMAVLGLKHLRKCFT